MTRKRAVHLSLIFSAAFILRIAMVFYAAHDSGMTSHYYGLSDMLSAGYGYQRTHIDHWVEFRSKLRHLSLELDQTGAKLDRQHRVSADDEELRPEFFRTPAYPVFLYAVYKAFGEPLDTHSQLIQAFFGAICPLLIYFIALRLFLQSGVAIGAAWLVALYPVFAYAAVVQLPVGLASFFVLAAILCLLRAVDNNSYLGMLFVGLLIAVSASFRPNVMTAI